MNISLTPQLEEFIKQKVSSGFYHSASEVVREALRLLEERDRLREMRLELLRKEIQEGIDQIERAEYTEYNEHTLRDLFEGVRIEGEKRLKANRQISG